MKDGDLYWATGVFIAAVLAQMSVALWVIYEIWRG